MSGKCTFAVMPPQIGGEGGLGGGAGCRGYVSLRVREQCGNCVCMNVCEREHKLSTGGNDKINKL